MQRQRRNAGAAPARGGNDPAQAPAAAGGRPFTISSFVRRPDFLTADGFAPYTGRSLERGGMLTQPCSRSPVPALRRLLSLADRRAADCFGGR